MRPSTSAWDTPGTGSSNRARRRHWEASAVEQFNVARRNPFIEWCPSTTCSERASAADDRQRLLGDHSTTMHFQLTQAVVEEPVIQSGEEFRHRHRHTSIVTNTYTTFNSFYELSFAMAPTS